MKITEAPEKIYLNDSMTTDTVGELYPEWFDAKVSDNSFEYIRIDVLMNKVEEWVKKTFTETDYRFKQDYTGMLITNFRAYMKGE